jgi:hypothetical protein
MRPYLYDAARALTTAGFTADIYFNPSEITNRLKKSIQRQITNCAVSGGYSSHAARVARHLLDHYKIPYANNYHWSSVGVQFQDEESKRKAVGVIQAGLAAYLLDDPYNPQYEKKRAAEDIEAINAGKKVNVRMFSCEGSNQILRIMAESLSPEVKEKARALAARLDDPTPIKIIMKDWS